MNRVLLHDREIAAASSNSYSSVNSGCDRGVKLQLPLFTRWSAVFAVRSRRDHRQEPTPPIPIAARVNRFTYAIRNIVAEARRSRRPARACGTSTSAIRWRSASRRRRTSSPRSSARCATATTTTGRRRASRRRAKRWPPSTRANGFPVAADRVFITAGTSEGIELDAERGRRCGRRSARADADLSAVHGGAREARRARRSTTGSIRRAAGCRISII